MDKEIHIVSLVIHVIPAAWDAVLNKARQLPEAECHANDKAYKFVLVFEAKSEAALINFINEINDWSGVLSSQLCYHHCETEESLKEEIQYEAHAS